MSNFGGTNINAIHNTGNGTIIIGGGGGAQNGEMNGASRGTELIYSCWSNTKMFESEDVEIPLKRKLLTGTTIRIEGTVPEDAVSIFFDLKSKDHVAFHVKFWFDQQVIVRNTFYKGHGWAQDETSTLEFPLGRGEKFAIVVVCDAVKGYTVYANDKCCCKFKNRVSLGEVINLKVGSAKVDLITLDA